MTIHQRRELQAVGLLTMIILTILIFLFANLPPKVEAQTGGQTTAAVSWKDGSYSTQQTGTALWTPTALRRVVVHSIELQCAGSTVGTADVWFGAGGDTTFNQGTDMPLTHFNCNTPSATNTPYKAVSFNNPVVGAADFVLRVTTSAGITLRVIVHGREQ